MKVVCLLSGGIDSPVAAYLMMKRGFDVILLHMGVSSSGNIHSEKVINLAKQIESVTGKNPVVYAAPHLPSQMKILATCRENLVCVLCKRVMLRVAEKLAEVEGAEAIVTGESLGQVASQTIENIRTEDCAVRIPILRPLIGFDKVEIIDIAKKIGTFDISIATKECCIAVPSKPATKAGIGPLVEEETRVEIETLIDNAFGGIIRII